MKQLWRTWMIVKLLVFRYPALTTRLQSQLIPVQITTESNQIHFSFLITFCRPKYEWIIINQFSDVSDDKHYVFDILSVEVRLSVINSFVTWTFWLPSENTRSVYQNNLVSPACETGFLAIQRLQIGNNVITNLTSFQPYHEKASNAVNTR